MAKRISVAVVAILLALAAVVAVRSKRPATPAIAFRPVAAVPVDEQAALERFVGALRVQTISYPMQPADAAAMKTFRDYLEASYPLVHHALRREVVGVGSLLFTWAGSEPTLAPVLMLGHMDTVPVDPGTLAAWSHPPFAAERADGFVWGRGSMDDKQAVCALLEAAEALLASGYRPVHTIYFAFGDDEENDGHGAEAIAALLTNRNVRPQFVMDEGGQIARGTIPGVRGDAALVGIAEKGIVSLQLTVSGATGHSSRPPAHTAVGILSRAVTRLEEQQMPARIGGVTGEMLEALAPNMDTAHRVMVSNRWLLGPWLRHSLEATPNGNALVRTTTAVTMLNGGIKDNVLPSKATAIVNFRLLPGDTVAGVKAHVRDVIADERITVSVYGDLAADPSPVSPTSGPGFMSLQQTIQQFFPAAAVTPNLLVARTDSARYSSISNDIYRFFPAVRDEVDGERVHGIDERLEIAGYLRAVQFMAVLLRREGA